MFASIAGALCYVAGFARDRCRESKYEATLRHFSYCRGSFVRYNHMPFHYIRALCIGLGRCSKHLGMIVVLQRSNWLLWEFSSFVFRGKSIGGRE